MLASPVKNNTGALATFGNCLAGSTCSTHPNLLGTPSVASTTPGVASLVFLNSSGLEMGGSYVMGTSTIPYGRRGVGAAPLAATE